MIVCCMPMHWVFVEVTVAPFTCHLMVEGFEIYLLLSLCLFIGLGKRAFLVCLHWFLEGVERGKILPCEMKSDIIRQISVKPVQLDSIIEEYFGTLCSLLCRLGYCPCQGRVCKSFPAFGIGFHFLSLVTTWKYSWAPKLMIHSVQCLGTFLLAFLCRISGARPGFSILCICHLRWYHSNDFTTAAPKILFVENDTC